MMGSKTAIAMIEDGVLRMSDGCGSDECALYGFEHRQIVDHIQAQDAEIMRLRTIVAKLPKTADGVAVVPGMQYFFRYIDDPDEIGEGIAGEIESDEYTSDFSRCYSTREAAEAAREAAK